MEALKFVQLAQNEFKQDAITDFCLTSRDNRIILLGSSSEIVLLELLYGADVINCFPYGVKCAPIPQDRPCTKLVSNIELQHIYENSTVQESQELALDPVYVADCSVDPPKAKVLQAHWAPKNHQMFAVLTSYGACQVLTKAPVTEGWEVVMANLSQVLICDVFPVKAAPLITTKFSEFRDFVDLYWITSFTWDPDTEWPTVYLGTAAGYIVALQYHEDCKQFKEYCHVKTPLGRISYITSHKQFLVAGCNQGIVMIFTIDHATTPPHIEQTEKLWSRRDRMSCRKAVFTYVSSLNCYYLVFAKGAHVLAYRLTKEGRMACSSTLYVSGIKVTGVESLSEDEFIITTMTGTVHYLRISSCSSKELRIAERVVGSDIDSANLQILGLAVSPNRSLWSFLLYRNKEYTHQSKYSQSSAFLSVCKLNCSDSLSKLLDLDIKAMNNQHDHIMAISMDLLNNMETDKYNNYLPLAHIQFPNELDDAFLQRLQVKLFILSNAVKFQKYKYKNVRRQTASELEFLQLGVQMTHILCRLSFLRNRGHSSYLSLSGFQQLAVACMQSRFALLMSELLALATDENPIKDTVERFAQRASDEFEHKRIELAQTKSTTEHCFECQQAISWTNLQCPQEHQVKRCSVSYVQLPHFQKRYCPLCFAFAVTDELGHLQELFAHDELVKCTFCRFLFVQDDI